MAGEVPRKHMCQFMVSEVHGERSGAGNLELAVPFWVEGTSWTGRSHTRKRTNISHHWKWGESSTQKCLLGWDMLVACPFFSLRWFQIQTLVENSLPFWEGIPIWLGWRLTAKWGILPPNNSSRWVKPDSLLKPDSCLLGEGHINIQKLGVQADLAFMQHCWVSSLVNWTRPLPCQGSPVHGIIFRLAKCQTQPLLSTFSCFFPSKWTWHELEGRTKILVPDFLLEIDASLQETWRSGWWYFWKLYFWAFQIACVAWDFFSCHLVEWLCGQSSPFFLPSGPSQFQRQNHHQQRTEIPPKKTHTSLTPFKMPWIKSSPRPGDSRLVSQPRRCRCIWCILSLIPRCRNCWTYPYVIVAAYKQL